MKRPLVYPVLISALLLGACLSSSVQGESPLIPSDGQPSYSSTPDSNPSDTPENGLSQSQTVNNSSGNSSVDVPADPSAPRVDLPRYLAHAGRDFLYLSSDNGQSWERLDIKPRISDATYLSAAAVNPLDSRHIVVGTSYYGLFESRDGGQNWADMDPDSRFNGLYQGAGFYNEINGLCFADDGSTLRIRTAFGGAEYMYRFADGNFSALSGSPAQQPVCSDQMLPQGMDPSAENSMFPADYVKDAAWQTRRERASDKVGLYLNSYQISSRLDFHIEYLVRNGFNSVVIDFKDDQGLVRYNSSLEIVRQTGTASPLYDAREIISRFHEAGIYVIGRIVVFKDKALYAYDNSRYALWDERLQEPWGVYRSYPQEASEENPNPPPRIEQVEYWVDPYSEFVRDYNIQLARELESLGVDEIQFDYIRFPSDGRTQDIVTRFLRDENGNLAHVDRNSQRVRILSTFLSEARESLEIPIGIDVFGFNAWARMSYLGQDIEVLSHYVDVISPMSYPSHYPRTFLPEMSYLDKAQHIYEEGSRRALSITGGRVLIRQYVQAFLIGGELNFEQPMYFDYLNRQLYGTMRGGGNGFTLWNNSGRYYMVDESSISDYIQRATRISEDSTDEQQGD